MSHTTGATQLYRAVLETLLLAGVLVSARAGISQTDQHNSPEISSRDEVVTFETNARLVLVRALVFDAHGVPVKGLKREDFQVFDKGKLQDISQFSVEQPDPTEIFGPKQPQLGKAQPEGSSETNDAGADSKPQPTTTARHFVAYLFDDEHLEFGNLSQVRDAAQRHLNTLGPTDRAAVFTTSGKIMQEFTDDRSALQAALLHIHALLQTGEEINPCPDISYYLADLIVNKHDNDAVRVATQDYLNCSQSNPSTYSSIGSLSPIAAKLAPQLIPSKAQQVLSRGDMQSQVSLGVLKDVVGRVSRMPGQRSVILISPGFLIPQMEYKYTDVVDRAVRGQVVISAIDARGLSVVIPGGDASKRGLAVDSAPAGSDAAQRRVAPSSDTADAGVLMSQYEAHAAAGEAATLSSLADGTGGKFFHNSNDFDSGFRRVAGPPGYAYLLGFAPQSLQPDGTFHSLKVSLRNSSNLTVQARFGYFAPKKFENAAEEATEAIEDEIYSQEELQAVPLSLSTQFFKTGEAGAKLSVLAHFDARHVHFRRIDGRNNDEFTIASALFDQNGNFLQGTQKVVTMHLLDATLERGLDHGMTMRTDFDVKPGRYTIRVVMRDADGQLSAKNTAAEIP